MSVSDGSVECRFDCAAQSFIVVVSGVSACAFHNVPLALHIGKVITGLPDRLFVAVRVCAVIGRC